MSATCGLRDEKREKEQKEESLKCHVRVRDLNTVFETEVVQVIMVAVVAPYCT